MDLKLLQRFFKMEQPTQIVLLYSKFSPNSMALCKKVMDNNIQFIDMLCIDNSYIRKRILTKTNLQYLPSILLFYANKNFEKLEGKDAYELVNTIVNKMNPPPPPPPPQPTLIEEEEEEEPPKPPRKPEQKKVVKFKETTEQNSKKKSKKATTSIDDLLDLEEEVEEQDNESDDEELEFNMINDYRPAKLDKTPRGENGDIKNVVNKLTKKPSENDVSNLAKRIEEERAMMDQSLPNAKK